MPDKHLPDVLVQVTEESEKIVKDIRRATHKRHSMEEIIPYACYPSWGRCKGVCPLAVSSDHAVHSLYNIGD